MMFDKTGSTRHKNEVNVSLTLTGQPPFRAVIFLKVGERIIDLLNDGRAFIPVRDEAGQTLFLAKTSIVSLVEVDQPQARAHEKSSLDELKKAPFDPYKVLRVKSDASLEAIRRAYKERIKAVHPDAIAALDLDEDLSRAALLATQKVNHAYKMIMRERDIEPVSGEYAG